MVYHQCQIYGTRHVLCIACVETECVLYIKPCWNMLLLKDLFYMHQKRRKSLSWRDLRLQHEKRVSENGFFRIFNGQLLWNRVSCTNISQFVTIWEVKWVRHGACRYFYCPWITIMGHKIDEHIIVLRLSAHVTLLCNLESVWMLHMILMLQKSMLIGLCSFSFNKIFFLFAASPRGIGSFWTVCSPRAALFFFEHTI